MTQGQRLPGLDAARFYAAVGIVLYHLGPIAALEMPSALRFIPAYFGFAVPLFYIVSALSLMLNHHGRLQDAASIKTFYAKRLLRIAPLFYLIMLIYIILIYYYYDRLVGAGEIIASALFVFNLLPGYVNGFVWASWSIGVEMVFYLVFPIVALYVRSTCGAAALFAATACLVFLWRSSFEGITDLASYRDLSVVPHMIYFAAGTLLYFVACRLPFGRARSVTLVLPASITGAMILIWVNAALLDRAYSAFGEAFSHTFSVTLWAVVLALLVLGLAFDAQRVLSPAWLCRLGLTSFSIYLWHPLVIFFLSRTGWYAGLSRLADDALTIFALSALSTVALTLTVAQASYRLIEVPGMRLRHAFAPAMARQTT